MLENQTSKALLYGQMALAVARAADLQGTLVYALLLKMMLDICINLQHKPCSGICHGEHAIPFEGFKAAAAKVKRELSRYYKSEDLHRFDTLIRSMKAGSKRCRLSLSGAMAVHCFVCVAANLFHL